MHLLEGIRMEQGNSGSWETECLSREEGIPKKRKIEDEMTYHKILQLYVTKINYTIDTQLPPLLNEYLKEKHSDKISSLEDQMKRVISKIGKTRKLCGAFSNFFSQQEILVSYSSQRLSREKLWKLFGGHASGYESMNEFQTHRELSLAELKAPFKAVFMDDYKVAESVESTYTVFTSCGFPLRVLFDYWIIVPDFNDPAETCFINGHRLFSHFFEKETNESHSVYSEKCLNYVKCILFGQHAQQEDSVILNTLLYDWLRLGLFENSHSYESSVSSDSKALPTFKNSTNCAIQF
ncbi:hypothetical protein FDP41_000577 [Naegleria fowleri]|uniref:Uncharacterized protein n=1 Tax=Naegleria fowleri TaxID=5763 RepID=A0A6A5CHB3_NAEFO|nr:uncharacterized protein FDP41_000577 [Naegleria fowleri]KAF0984678.1 hypothetical protein FDP41_000577 [Naegleria fowleri]CAG4718082.1 unnamed protein product [Naegleria fowleri]